MFNLSSNRKTVLAGQCGQAGDRVGELDVMLLRGPRGVVSYQANPAARDSEQQMRMRVVRDSTCGLTEPGCLMTN